MSPPRRMDRLRVTIDEEGETRIRHRFIVSTPVAGRVLRVDLEPGDRIKRGGVVTRVQPEPPALLDARTRAEAEASVEALRAALNRSRAEEGRARTARDLALTELRRARELDAAGLTTRQAVEMQEAEARAAEEAVRAASSAVAFAQAELERARARLRPPTSAASTGVVELAAPIDGVILKRFRESESVVPAGERLVEMGDPRDLEVVSDLLSTDAVRVAPGARVLIAEWGGDRESGGARSPGGALGFHQDLRARRRRATGQRHHGFQGPGRRLGETRRRLPSRGSHRGLGVRTAC